MTLLYKKIRIFRKINQILIKYRKTKKTRIRTRNVLIIKNVHSLIKQKEIVRQQLSKRLVKENVVQTESSDVRRCKRYDKTNYNVRICQEIKEISEKDSDIESN